MCAMQACSVCECDANEVPSSWLAQEQGSCATAPPPPAAELDSEEHSSGSSAAPCTTAECEQEKGGVEGEGLRYTFSTLLWTMQILLGAQRFMSWQRKWM